MGLGKRIAAAWDKALLGNPEGPEEPASDRGARRVARDHGWVDEAGIEAKNVKYRAKADKKNID